MSHLSSATDAASIARQILAAPHQPLDRDLRIFFESRFGARLDQVSLHTGPLAAASARALHARAFTFHRHIVFDAGQYAPHTAGGMRLLAHELAHILQQRETAPQDPVAIGAPDDVLEMDADRAAGAVLSGAPVRLSALPPGSPARIQCLGRDVPNDDEVLKAYDKRDHVQVFKILNGRSMEGILDTLTTLQKKGFMPWWAPGTPNDTPMVKAGVNIARLRVALAAVYFAGRTSPGEFQRDFDRYMTSLPRDQRLTIVAYMMIHAARVAVWASGRDVAGAVCEDARLHSEDGSTILTRDTIHGQAGWDLGVQFQNCHDLAAKLRDKSDDKAALIKRLAINCHGYPGEFYINGKDRTPLKSDNIMTDFGADLTLIKASTDLSAVILLVGCLSGRGPLGTKLVEALSGFFKYRTIVAFATVGYDGSSAQMRPASGRGTFEGVCTEPGSRDTDNEIPSGGDSRLEYKRYFEKDNDGKSPWNDLAVLPWSSETSPHAKVAVNGKVIRGDLL